MELIKYNLYTNLIIVYFRDGSRTCRRRGRQPLRVASTQYIYTFSEKTHEIKGILVHGGRVHTLEHSLDPPLYLVGFFGCLMTGCEPSFILANYSYAIMEFTCIPESTCRLEMMQKAYEWTWHPSCLLLLCLFTFGKARKSLAADWLRCTWLWCH